jgi:hypothetical protein
MEIVIEPQGIYGSECGQAAGQPFGQVRFTTANGRSFKACIGRSPHQPDVHLFQWWASGGPSGLDSDFWSDSVCLELPFEQAACVIAGMMLKAAEDHHREVFRQTLPLLEMTYRVILP